MSCEYSGVSAGTSRISLLINDNRKYFPASFSFGHFCSPNPALMIDSFMFSRAIEIAASRTISCIMKNSSFFPFNNRPEHTSVSTIICRFPLASLKLSTSPSKSSPIAYPTSASMVIL
ncbi:hypothetical protein GIB67_012415 [Kingdonia uniflora]|uniref:Uncharacterized protein n=1 Tax=Kingdonia uniflora TaxID=39325 RepID=A0A7J7LLT7_9MAGN|nr:hypothetical protein GIB67_012415 [Kingdonia uniflora]